MKIFHCIVFLLIIIFYSGCDSGGDSADLPTLRLYAGAGLRRGIDALVSEFKKQSGITVDVDYGGSGMIISRAREDRSADLFMPGDVWYVDKLQEKSGCIESKTAVAYFVPVIITAKGNPEKIFKLKDFLRKDIKIAVGNSKACQIGRLTMKIFKKNGLDASNLKAKEGLTVNELGVWVKMHDADAAIVWDAIAANIAEDIEIVEIPPGSNVISKVVIGLMKGSHNKRAAQKFIDFIISGKGKDILKSKGYRTENYESRGGKSVSRKLSSASFMEK
jgi:molybdate transport system substrate-binding protein